MSVTFLIKYARATTDTGVSDVFKATLECEVVKVTSLDKIDTHNGNRTFKMFFVVVKKNERVERFAEQIKQHGFMTIIYNHPYYWKIYLAETKPPRPPRIMTIEEQERVVRRAPAAEAAPQMGLKEKERLESRLSFSEVADPVAEITEGIYAIAMEEAVKSYKRKGDFTDDLTAKKDKNSSVEFCVTAVECDFPIPTLMRSVAEVVPDEDELPAYLSSDWN